MSKITLKQIRSLSDILTSSEMEDLLETLMARVKANASRDPNSEYVDSLRSQIFYSRGAGRMASRKVGQVGAKPGLGTAVEASRGTLARALRESI